MTKNTSTNNPIKEKWTLKLWALLLVGIIMILTLCLIVLPVDNEETHRYITTKAPRMSEMHDEARTISPDNEWIEGCWLTKDPKVHFSFSIRGGIITITESDDQIDSGEYYLHGNVLRYKGYTFVLDKENHCIRLNDDIIFTPSGYYY